MFRPVLAGKAEALVGADIGDHVAGRVPIAAWPRIRPIPGEPQRVAQILRDLPEMAESDRSTGEDCFIVCAHVGSVGDLDTLIDELISYAVTKSSIIQSSPVERRLPRFA